MPAASENRRNIRRHCSGVRPARPLNSLRKKAGFTDPPSSAIIRASSKGIWGMSTKEEISKVIFSDENHASARLANTHKKKMKKLNMATIAVTSINAAN